MFAIQKYLPWFNNVTSLIVNTERFSDVLKNAFVGSEKSSLNFQLKSASSLLLQVKETFCPSATSISGSVTVNPSGLFNSSRKKKHNEVKAS